MSRTKRQADLEPLPRWGRPKTSITSSGTLLTPREHGDGFYTEDTRYRPKRKRAIVRWQPIDEEHHGSDQAQRIDTDAQEPTLEERDPPPIYHDIGSEMIDGNVHYDRGYTQHERERKVSHFHSALWIII